MASKQTRDEQNSFTSGRTDSYTCEYKSFGLHYDKLEEDAFPL